MSIEWTDAEREAVRRALDHHRHMRFGLPDALLDALAPHVGAMLDQARAEGAEKALREAAGWIRSATEGVDQAGTATWPAHDRAIYALAIEEVEDALRERADRVGGAS